MKKYLHIYKTTLIDSIQYINNIILGFISFFILMFIFINLWQYLYDDPSQLISGYSYNQMIWYILISEFIWFSVGTRVLIRDISEDIKSGSIAYNLNKPYSYVGYVLSKSLGDLTIKMIMYLIVSISFGLIFVGTIPNFNPTFIPFMTISIIIAILVNMMIAIAIACISFWIEDSAPFYWIYSKLILVFGIFFPIDLFPKVLRGILKYTPVLVVVYGPSRLVVNFSMASFYEVVSIQLVYFIIISIILYLVFKKGVKKLNVNGG